MDSQPDGGFQVACSKGWYPDPHSQIHERWFDGERWSGKVRRTDPTRDARRSPRPRMPRGAKAALWVAGIIIVVGTVLMVAVVAMFYAGLAGWADNK